MDEYNVTYKFKDNGTTFQEIIEELLLKELDS